ncbi:3-phosphoshikimate 1-carboxyvinyltransferase [Candidatus Nitrosacidococcus sp. I8]|uniref:3-phosphoshikimate 1-carboxyvinyltransferase n=1 Tax=Candidatus Nitrosacidococcus sp. I8 TaxID=2942908 RepID=UPI002227A70F|nr:3-phosphoshikimate 1-carboxyvinyltransferase [Candidatus Nitrosacidococcus sp. I8]CAH9018397.1 3-phosphoshikimate 1-carboxyvinyltransferase [Candidatus Nitrosacidococcus sp. I8]
MSLTQSSDNLIIFVVLPSQSLLGHIRVPGDKSISHRSIMMGALAEGKTTITGFLEGEDTLATLKAFRELGVLIKGPENGKVEIFGVGIHGLQAPSDPIYLGNSGTSMRILAGLFSGQSFDTTLEGDISLSKRPMKRVCDPLAQMGAVIETTDKGTPPLYIHGNRALNGINYNMPIASAQVKSSLIFAGLYAKDKTCITEPAPTRDHTEKMLAGFGYPIEKKDNSICIMGGRKLHSTEIDIPADISSAAFFMVGAAISQGSEVILEHVGINPTRTGIINILKLMGAQIEVEELGTVGGESVGTIYVRSSQLHGIDIPKHLVPLAIDEFPALFIAAACAKGTTTLSGAEELRVKESDRIQVMADGLNTLGIKAQSTPDGIIIEGGKIKGGLVYSHGDHRCAMSFAMAALASQDAITINDCANVATSFPGFLELASNAGLAIRAI